jgi:hypothetical protein
MHKSRFMAGAHPSSVVNLKTDHGGGDEVAPSIPNAAAAGGPMQCQLLESEDKSQ